MYKAWFVVLWVGCVLTLLSACQPQSPERATELAFKGVELYSWQDGTDEWQYALLPGTNRIKTLEEVLANPLDQTGLEAAITKLAAGETVFWTTRVVGEDFAITLAYPPQEVSDAILQRAAEADVHVAIVCP